MLKIGHMEYPNLPERKLIDIPTNSRASRGTCKIIEQVSVPSLALAVRHKPRSPWTFSKCSKQMHVTRQKTDWRINWKPSIIYHQKKARENWGDKGEPLSSCTPCSCRIAAGNCSCPGCSLDLETRHIFRDFIKYTRNNRQLVLWSLTKVAYFQSTWKVKYQDDRSWRTPKKLYLVIFLNKLENIHYIQPCSSSNQPTWKCWTVK